MRPTDTPTDAELAALITGQLAEARAKELERWAAIDPANIARLNDVRSMLAVPTAAPWNRARIWAPIGKAIERGQTGPTDQPPAVIRSTPVRVAKRTLSSGAWYRLTAAAILVIAAGNFLLRRLLPWGVANSESVAQEYVTGRGERTTVQLADGSRITLAPESRLRVLAGFGAPERRVELDGEATFNVVHDSAHRFRVRAGGAVVEDIGTRFDLRAYATDGDTRVAVAEGAVTIARDSGSRTTARPGDSHAAEGVLVQRGEVARLDSAGHASTARIENDDAYFGWTDGRLVFARQPLRDVISTLGRWLDVDVHIPDSTMANRLVTATFAPDSAPDVIRALARAVNASVVGSGHTLTLVSK